MARLSLRFVGVLVGAVHSALLDRHYAAYTDLFVVLTCVKQSGARWVMGHAPITHAARQAEAGM